MTEYFSWQEDFTKRVKNLYENSIAEGIPFSQNSSQGAKSFARKIKSSIYPSIFLIGNGNVRFVWENERNQIGLQFLDQENVQYILFKENEKGIERYRGYACHEFLISFINYLSLDNLLHNSEG